MPNIIRKPDLYFSSTRRRRWVLAGSLLVMLSSLLAAVAGWVIAGQAGWLICLPAGLLGVGTLGLRLALWRSRGGLQAVLAGRRPPSMPPPQAAAAVQPVSQTAPQVTIWVDLERPVAQTPPEFLSFALDTAQLVGGKWWHPEARRAEFGSGIWQTPVFDFDRPLLVALTRALAPAYLRLGGSEADKVYYALDLPERQGALPSGFASRLTAEQWIAANTFARRCGLQIIFTLNAGPGPRRSDGSWNAAHAAALLDFSARQGFEIPVWELGNELNVGFAVLGRRGILPVERYAADLRAARLLLARYSPGSRLAGQGSAFWPILGEPLGFFFGYLPDYLRLAAEVVQVITWHYYPQQSRRAPQAVRRAHPARLLDPANLDEFAHWAGLVQDWAAQYAPGKPVWLGETGPAQNGGEPGLSDTYLSGLWWLDQLGLMARLGQQVVVRQTLAGGDYGLLDERTLQPRPDYWNSWLWKRLMGAEVYVPRLENPEGAALRVYAHASCGGSAGSFTLLVINLDSRRGARIALPQAAGRDIFCYRLSAKDIYGQQLLLNGQPLQLQGEQLPKLVGERWQSGPAQLYELPPLNYAFLQVV